uniref:Poly [ADP-ribose] polymerase n=1 Tax=Gadus morhua TaxID=8049 RepID=A0A8C5BGJ7_GADMO
MKRQENEKMSILCIFCMCILSCKIVYLVHGDCFVSQGLFSKVTSASGLHEITIGHVRVQVVLGDITKETTDVIVNSSNESFSLKSGVSKAILDAAGPTVENECKNLGGQPNTGMILTTPGNLMCKKILHLLGRSNPQDIQDTMKAALVLVEQNQYTSISFPALGTGEMDNSPFIQCRHPAHYGHSEYHEQQSIKLLNTIQHNTSIIIERIQNPVLWKSLQLKKADMEARNGHKNNERRLFHGACSISIQDINQYGFNRSYAGKNAACYGNGTYFAINANYSAQDTYSKPDAQGQKCVYLCRVLTGDFTKGTQGMLVPPTKASSALHYDSVVNDINSIQMFVIFHDTHAYPEYLITFK